MSENGGKRGFLVSFKPWNINRICLRVWRQEREAWRGRWREDEEAKGRGGERGGERDERERERWRPTPALCGTRLIYRLSNAH